MSLATSAATQRVSKSLFQFRRDASGDEHALGRHAGRAGVEREAESQRFHGESEIGVGANDDGVAAAQFQRGRDKLRCELGENFFARGRGTGEDDLVWTSFDGAAG